MRLGQRSYSLCKRKFFSKLSNFLNNSFQSFVKAPFCEFFVCFNFSCRTAPFVSPFSFLRFFFVFSNAYDKKTKLRVLTRWEVLQKSAVRHHLCGGVDPSERRESDEVHSHWVNEDAMTLEKKHRTNRENAEFQ